MGSAVGESEILTRIPLKCNLYKKGNNAIIQIDKALPVTVKPHISVNRKTVKLS